MPTIEQAATQLGVYPATLRKYAERDLSHHHGLYDSTNGRLTAAAVRVLHDTLIQEGVVQEPAKDIYAQQTWRRPKFYGPQ